MLFLKKPREKKEIIKEMTLFKSFFDDFIFRSIVNVLPLSRPKTNEKILMNKMMVDVEQNDDGR